MSRLLVTWSAVLLLFLVPTRWAWASYLTAVGSAWAVWFLVGLYGHAPQYLFHAAYPLALWVGLMNAGWPAGRSSLAKVAAAAAVVLAIDLHPVYRHLRDRSKQGAANARQLADLVRALDPRPDRLYLIWGGAFPYEWVPPWADLTRFRDLKGYPLACTTNTPHADARRAEFGIDNPAAALCERPGEVLLMCYPGQEQVLVRFFVRRHARVVAPDLVPGADGRPLPGGRVLVYRWRLVGHADEFMTEEWVRNAR